MTPLLLLSIVGLVVSKDADSIQVDRGMLHGLRPGDTGGVFYMLTVDARQRRVDVAVARVATVSDEASSLVLLRPADIRPGYSVEFQIPPDRLSATTLMDLAKARMADGKFDQALRFLEKIREIMPEDLFVRQQLQEAEEKLLQIEWRKRELANLDYYRSAAMRFLGSGDPRSAEKYILKIWAVAAEDPSLPDLQRRLESQFLSADMLQLPKGVYDVGADLEQAQSYNQYPKFRVSLAAFWIDRRSVSSADYQAFKVGQTLPASARNQGIAAVAFQEAQDYCKWLGKRLPSEFEWEVAAQQNGFDSSQQILEWTQSWYEPYPGNIIWEQEYGQKLRVLRGISRLRKSDPRTRLFSAPDSSRPYVGFRCARDSEIQAGLRPEAGHHGEPE